MVYCGRVGRNHVCYVDTRATLGCFVELIQRDAACDQVFAKIAASGHRWDGTDPIRTWG